MTSPNVPPRWFVSSACVLLLVLFAELFFSVRQNSQTFDESAHIYAGYTYWTRHDFGVNPEHPPLAKLIATVPLLPMHLHVQPPPPIHFRPASSMGGRKFLYTQDADAILLRSRMAISIFTFALALLVLLSAREMFGIITALVALLLFVFEPNILANGALVTTDMALSATLFAAVYAFYRYTRRPTTPRLLLCAFAVGLVLCVKHSGLIVLPLLVLLAAGSLFLARSTAQQPPVPRGRSALRMAGALIVIFAIAYGMLWAAYGFRYAARPGNAAMTPTPATLLGGLDRPHEARVIGFSEQHHLLPQAYLYGLTDVATITSEGRPTFLFGKLYPAGVWYYFPSTFVIKSTLGLLLLLALTPIAAHLWRKDRARELLFLLLPSLLYFLIACSSRLNIGHRHILPIYAFLIILAAAGAALLLQRSRAWAVVVIVLLAFHVVSSARAYPAYLAYSNEVWGGPSQTWKVLADSNTGWASGLKPLQRYIRDNNIRSCWLAYSGSAQVAYFKLPCKPLPTMFSMAFRDPQGPVPAQIQGPIFVGSLPVTGWGMGPAQVNPFDSFLHTEPEAVLDGEILVYSGSYNVPRLAALSHLVASRKADTTGHPQIALSEAQQAEALAPELIMTHEALSDLYAANHQPTDALREYNAAVQLYDTIYSTSGRRPVQPAGLTAGPPRTASTPAKLAIR